MLTKVKFQNYKAFREGNIEVKPLTILLGANSVGKSSLLQLFLMLQETALAENYKSALKLHGPFFSLGEGINLFRKKDNKNALHLEFSFNESSIGDVLNREGDKFLDELMTICYFVIARLPATDRPGKEKEKSTKMITELLTWKRGQITREAIENLVKRSYEIISRNKAIVKDIATTASDLRNTIRKALLSDKDELLKAFDFFKKLQGIENSEKVRIEYDFKYSESVLKIRRCKLHIGNIEIANIDLDAPADDFISSDLIDFRSIHEKQKAELKNSFKSDRTVFSFIENTDMPDKMNSLLCVSFRNTVSEVFSCLQQSFNSQRINYVSPLRAHPKRYYFLDKAKVNKFLDTLDGEAIAEILKDNSNLKDSVNNWFKRFNLKINVGPIKDVIHQIWVNQNSLDLDITDVGFGVSQILPVIIQGFLSKEGSITLIEQPEIHLHPKMQADLADLFIDIAIRKNERSAEGRFLVIETHSEYLLKRLRRRISEGTVHASQVAIYYVEQEADCECTTIKKIDIGEKGAFDWPKDFYTGDLAADVFEFLKNQ